MAGVFGGGAVAGEGVDLVMEPVVDVVAEPVADEVIAEPVLPLSLQARRVPVAPIFSADGVLMNPADCVVSADGVVTSKD